MNPILMIYITLIAVMLVVVIFIDRLQDYFSRPLEEELANEIAKRRMHMLKKPVEQREEDLRLIKALEAQYKYLMENDYSGEAKVSVLKKRSTVKKAETEQPEKVEAEILQFQPQKQVRELRRKSD